MTLEGKYLERDVLTGKRREPEDFEDEDMEEVYGGGGKRIKSTSDLLNVSESNDSSGQASSGSGEPDGAGSNLIGEIGRDLSINCLIRLSRSDYGSMASVNWDFNSLVRNGEIYRQRRQNGMVEYWVYFSCNALEWDAYDPYRKRWIQVPKMPPDVCFMFSDKESLAVGTELLVFGLVHIVFRYSILTNSWTQVDPMNSPRCLFGSTSVSEKAYVAGGIDSSGQILSSAEMYDSETHTWTHLPSMSTARKMCSRVFMDGKFYVLGGVTNNDQVLTCVVKNQLYAADYSENDVKRYGNVNNKWITLGKLHERSMSMNGWGLAFRACGDRLIVIGGPSTFQPPVWNFVATQTSGNFVYNCAVMGC
ncbi:hypothetical protein BRADI_1g73150v3 [Brachypodium distachyon]|uniref:Attractin/MKLN-like beta-propeller domain-containing protein n=1 Tax=Brachypodium distachyon TaxID=15368 RepID=A0A0Q3HKK4_BRADI|nr:hypothetical protein BRADI_1g73150v3 [Brachypodium distachyon]